MSKNVMAALVVAALFSTAGAVAQEKTVEKGSLKKGGDMFEKLDANKDGKLSLAEAEKAPKGRLKDNFTAIDTNKDNYLDKQELKAYREKKKAEKQASKQK